MLTPANHDKKVSIAGLLAFTWLVMTPTWCQAENAFLLNSVTIDSQAAWDVESASAQSDMSQFFKAQKELVSHILTQVGLAPETLPSEIRESLSKPQTTNLDAFYAFSKGLDHLDNENYEQAKLSFSEAVTIDPGFQLAVTLQSAMPEIGMDVVQVVSKSNEAGSKKAKSVLKKVAKAKAKTEAKKAEKSEVKEADKAEGSDSEEGSAEKGVAEERSDSESLVEEGGGEQDLEGDSSDGQDGELFLGSASKENKSVVVEQKLLSDLASGSHEFIQESGVDLESKSKQHLQEPEDFTDPVTTAITEDIKEEVIIASQELQTDCEVGLCGYYVWNLLKTETKPDGNSTTSLAGNPYITRIKGSELETGGEVVIEQHNSSGYMKGDASPALANIKAFSESSSGLSGSSDTNVAALTGTVDATYTDENGATALEVGTYSAEFLDDENAFRTLGNVSFDAANLHFAEGVATSLADLIALKNNTDLEALGNYNTTYAYSGFAKGTLIKMDPSGLYESMDGSGAFNANVHYGKGEVTEFSLITEHSTSSMRARMSIDAQSVALNTDGTFAITPGSTSRFLISAGDIVDGSTSLANPRNIVATDGLANGRTFGANAAALGGVYMMQANETTTDSSATSQSGTSWAAGGYFGGRRSDLPTTTGTVGGSE